VVKCSWFLNIRRLYRKGLPHYKLRVFFDNHSFSFCCTLAHLYRARRNHLRAMSGCPMKTLRVRVVFALREWSGFFVEFIFQEF
jgi:hypothetical protein